MSEHLRYFTNAAYAFDHVLKSASPKALERSSPCAGWKGRDVVQHAMGGVQYVANAIAGGSSAWKEPKLGADVLGQWIKIRDTTLTALDQAGVLHAEVNSFFGPMPVDQLIAVMASDLTVHSWDLARTARVDERLETSLVKRTAALWKAYPEAMLRQPGVLGPKVPSAKGADAQTRLLNFMGRTP